LVRRIDDDLSKGAAMALFSKDPQRVLERDIASAKANRDRLAAKLLECEAAISQHREQAKTAAATGAEDATLDLAEGLIRSAQDRHTTLAAALGDVEAQLAALERTHADNADRILREQTAASVELLARRVLESAEVMVKAAAAFAGHIEKAAAVAPEAAGLLNFAVIVGNEIPGAVAQTGALLRAHAAAVIAGSAPSAMPEPAPAYIPPPVAAKPPAAQLFCLRSIKFVDDTGQQRFVGQYRDASVPQRLVARALRSGACVAVSDPCRAKLHTQGDTTQHPDGAFDLDEPEPRVAEPIMQSSPFVVVDRGPPKIVQIATRSLT
jgi:hypothetical protein